MLAGTPVEDFALHSFMERCADSRAHLGAQHLAKGGEEQLLPLQRSLSLLLAGARLRTTGPPVMGVMLMVALLAVMFTACPCTGGWPPSDIA